MWLTAVPSISGNNSPCRFGRRGFVEPADPCVLTTIRRSSRPFPRHYQFLFLPQLRGDDNDDDDESRSLRSTCHISCPHRSSCSAAAERCPDEYTGHNAYTWRG